MHIKSFSLLLLVPLALSAQVSREHEGNKAIRPLTFCNPLDLPYRFQLDGNQREAADPVIVLFNDEYWLFASKCGGYWHSADMVHWAFVKPEGLPLEHYAPAILVFKGRLLYFADNAMYTTQDPYQGKWTKIATLPFSVADPTLFADDDGKLFLYHGCREYKPLNVVELDTETFQPVIKNLEIVFPDIKTRGWEVAGDNNLGKVAGDTAIKNFLPWIEGSWMNKINGKYYLQYAGPGTQFKSYGDGVFVSDAPTGPFTYAPYSPFSFKPGGFVAGVGHSATFTGKNKQLWHVTSVAISVRHMFERRLALFPTGVLPDGQLVTNTYLGDYPQFAPGTSEHPLENNCPGWMLLSYHKPALASSTLGDISGKNFSVENAFDEEITSWWAAATGNKGEWLQVDLKKPCRVDAIQVNFADQGCKATGRLENDGYQYFIEISTDGKQWEKIADRTNTFYDEPHHYIQLEKPETTRFVRITNVHAPAGSVFSLYDFRIFGSGLGDKPVKVTEVSAVRNSSDPRRCTISWEAVPNTDFYIVRYGIAPGKLFGNYQVHNSTSININALNTGVKYYFTIDAINESGIAAGEKTVSLD